MGTKHILLIITTLLMCISTTAEANDIWFTQAVSNEWNDANNWLIDIGGTFENHLPIQLDRPLIGVTGIDATAIIRNGEAMVCSGFEIANGGDGTLTIEAGGSLNSIGGSWWVGYGGGLAQTATLNIYGEARNTNPINIAGQANANVTIGAGATLDLAGGDVVGVFVGADYYMSPDRSFEYTVTQGVNSVVSIRDTGSGARSFFMAGAQAQSLYQLNGGTIIAEGEDGWNGYGYWQVGGTMEITADSRIDVTNLAVLANGTNQYFGEVGRWLGYAPPVLKFSGADTLLTMNADVYINTIDPTDPNNLLFDANSTPVQIDVNDLTLSTTDTWHTIIQTDTITYGDLLDFVPGTDANVWSIRVDGNQVQVMFTGEEPCVPSIADIAPVASGGDGIVDGADLGALLARWKDTGDSIADIAPVASGGDGIVDGADLGALLARWKDTTVCPEATPAVPEPATMSLLALAGIGLLRRRSA